VVQGVASSEGFLALAVVTDDLLLRSAAPVRRDKGGPSNEEIFLASKISNSIHSLCLKYFISHAQSLTPYVPTLFCSDNCTRSVKT
jgi:hypothetical protein